MFLFHMQPKHTNSQRQEQTRARPNFRSMLLLKLCNELLPTWGFTQSSHTLTYCFTSCAKVNHIYTFKFHLGLECIWWAKSQTNSYVHTHTQCCTPTAEHKGHETLGGDQQSDVRGVYSKPSKSCTPHMTHENHNNTDHTRYVKFSCHRLISATIGSVSACRGWFPLIISDISQVFSHGQHADSEALSELYL